jgi:hypothetical protein
MAMFDTQFTPRTIVSRLAAFVAAGLFSFTAFTALAQTQPEAAIPNRITQAINPEVRVTLQHNMHPLALAKYDQGAAPGSMATGRIMLVLKRSDMQNLALRQYLGDLQNPHSPNYRKWLTPEQFGRQYGISDTDLTTVTAWLQSQGFTVEQVPQARNVVIFSGNVAQIHQAFNTSIHRYFVNGEAHLANSTDPQIPAALAPVIAGVAPLNDFRPKRGVQRQIGGRFDPETKTIKPDLTLNCTSSGCALPGGSNSSLILFANAADAATIYDTPIPALNKNYSSSLVGGNTYDGTGVTIGIAGDSNITVQDINNYRSAFLPSSYPQFQQSNVIVVGNDPGMNGDAIEALLDLEVSGGIAPGATVNFYTGADTDLQSGLFLAIYRALDDNAVSILNVSFGACEANQGDSGNAQILNAWQQAAAQGISVTASTGDSGSAGCDNPNTETAAANGLAISGLASTAYNIAVGGTDYNALQSTSTSFSQYVGTTNAASSYYRTALSYIPESPWNDSPTTNNGPLATNTAFKDSSGNTNITGAGGGISDCVQTSGNTCTGGYAVPPFQTGLPASLNFGFSTRAVPDISLLAADGAYGALWVVCSDNVANGSSTTAQDCQQTSGSLTSSSTFTGVGGTSAASPAFAGMLALVSQSQGGVRLGQANNVLYNLASQAALYPTVFHDVTTGNNSVVCTGGSAANCGSNSFLTGYNAGAGYDAATGLGSVDVSQLIANWKKATITATTTSIKINGSTSAVSVQHGTTLNFGISVTPSSATGDVSIVNNSGVQSGGASDQSFGTLSSGSLTGTYSGLPGGGPYTVSAYYGGDVKNAGSTSNGVTVTISPEPSTTLLNVNIYDASTGNTVCQDGSSTPCVGASVPYGLFNFALAQPVCTACIAGTTITPNGVATGTVNFFDGSNSLATSAIASNGVATYTNYQIVSQTFSVGTHSVTAAYGGDGSFNGSTSTATAFKVIQAATTTAAASSATSVGSTASVMISVAVAADSLGAPPSGNVQLFNGSTAVGAAVAVTQGYSSTTGLVQSTASFTLTGSQLLGTVKMAKQDRSAFPWGISGGAAAMACVLFFAIPARRRSWRALLALIVFAIIVSGATACGGGSSSGGGGGGGGGGTATITAKYVGDTNYSASTSTAITITVTQ